MLITKTKDLESFCQSLSDDFISLDTEFFRETTYYPKLCLIQIASKKRAVIIDPLEKDLDLSALNEVLQNDKITKVLHSAKQDLEVLYHLFKQLPKNIFDTQIAASFCGFGDSISYEALVLDIIGTQIDKSYCVSDWQKRPLHQKQIEYALGDVTHLRVLYQALLEKLQKNQRLHWAIEDMQMLNDTRIFIVDLAQAWKKVKNTYGSPINLVFKKLSTWREQKAIEHNLPRAHYLHDKHLHDLVTKMPITYAELKKIKKFSNTDLKTANEIIEVITGALAEQINEELDPPINSYKYDEAVRALKNLLLEKTIEHALPAKIVATNHDLRNILTAPIPAKYLSGWRHEIFGKEAIKIKESLLS